MSGPAAKRSEVKSAARVAHQSPGRYCTVAARGAPRLPLQHEQRYALPRERELQVRCRTRSIASIFPSANSSDTGTGAPS
jgi:hypothetical protein